MDSLFPVLILFVLSGCLGFQTPQNIGSASVPRLESSLTLSVPLPKGAALPYSLTKTAPSQSPIIQTQYKRFPTLTSKPLPTLFQFWLNQNSPYITRRQSENAAWKTKSLALTAATKKLQIYLNSLVERLEMATERSESRKVLISRRIMPSLQNMISVYSPRIPSRRPDMDSATGILRVEVARDMDCETMPEVVGRDVSVYYPMSCDDDRCPPGKECRNIGNVGMCCPSTVTSESIHAKAYYGY